MDVDDVLYRAPIDGFRENPTNDNSELHDQALLCVTDLEDCCDAPRTVRGDWYYPDGSIVLLGTIDGPVTFQRNRGPNEVINGRQFYGSVRLFRRYSRPPERGRFRCELPSAADPSVNQTLYANIGELLIVFRQFSVTHNMIIFSFSSVDFGNFTLNPVTLPLSLWAKLYWSYLFINMLSNSY